MNQNKFKLDKIIKKKNKQYYIFWSNMKSKRKGIFSFIKKKKKGKSDKYQKNSTLLNLTHLPSFEFFFGQVTINYSFKIHMGAI